MPGPQLPTDLIAVLERLSKSDIERLLCDLLSPSEVEVLGERWEIVKMLAAGASQRDVRDRLRVGVATVSRGSKQLKYGHQGFAVAFELLGELGLGDPRAANNGRTPRRTTK